MTNYKVSNIMYFLLAMLLVYIFTFVVSDLVKFIWPDNIKNSKPFLFWLQFINHQVAYVSCNFFMFLIYRYENDFIRSLKVHELEWPWVENKEKWKEFLKANAKVILFNQLIVVPLLLYLSIYVKGSKLRTDYESLPSGFEVLWQILICMILEDFAFYWSHRFLHWSPIYPYIHKIHHQHINVVSIASEYAHPVEFIFGNVIPANLGIIFLGSKMHAFTAALWIFIRIIKTTEAHSGYQFPWSPLTTLPGEVCSDFHNFHHAKFTGNYSSFFLFWDHIMGTVNPGYTDYKKNLENKKNN